MSARLDLIWNVTLQFLLVIVFGMPMIKGLHARCHIGRAGDYAWESTVSLHTCRSHCTTAETSHHWGKLHFHNICPMSIASGLLTACTVYLVGFCQNTEKSWRWKWDVGRIHLSSYLQNYSHPILVVVLRQTFVRWNIMKTGANVQCAYKYMSVSSTPIQKKKVIVAMIMVVKKKPYFAHNDSICWETPVSTMARRKSTDMFGGTRPARQDDIIVVIGDHQLWY